MITIEIYSRMLINDGWVVVHLADLQRCESLSELQWQLLLP